MPHKRASSGETRLRILEYIARHGEASKWQLAQELQKSYSVIYKNIKKMLVYGFLKIVRVEPSQKNPAITVEFYDLTDGGLVEILNYEKPWEHIDEIAQTHSDKLRLIFGKWNFYKQKKVIDVIITHLQFAVLSYRPSLSRKWGAYLVVADHSDFETRVIKKYGKEEGKHLTHLKKSIVSSLTDKVLGIKHPKEFIETVIEDADLKRYYDQRFEEWQKKYKKEYNEFQELTNWYQNIRSQV